MDIYKEKNFVELMISDAEAMMSLYINVHDRMGVMRDANGEPLFKRRVHSCPYCQAGRSNIANWEAYCQRDCHFQSDKIAMLEQKPYTKTCWKGVFDIVVPVVDGTTVPAVIYGSGFKGQIPDEALVPDKFITMHSNLRDIPEQNVINRYTRTLWQLGQALLNYAKNINTPSKDGSGRRASITRFIQQNAHRNINLKDLASELHLSSSRARHLVIELFGRTFKHLLTAERMLRARTLLASTNIPLEEVCESTGFNNVYYFNSAFKKYFGMPPGRYRNVEALRESS